MKNDNAWDDESGADELPKFKRLTSEEAQALRARFPSVSPWRVVGVQALAGAVCAVLVGVVTQRIELGWSALYGAVAVVLPSALLAFGITRKGQSAMTAAAAFLVWEMVKIGMSVALLLLAPRFVPQLNWPALLVVMLVCFKVNWLALLWRGR